MSRSPLWDFDSQNPNPPPGDTPAADKPGFESDFAELRARFMERAAGLPPELSADLALDVVLNEIVEQACLATGATGAAIALKRDQELVCRATGGSTAPELGSRIDASQGLSGECVRTGQTQVCIDAEIDSRTDAVAARLLGVRSIIVLPLARGMDLVGILEAFSTRPGAFGERDCRTLEVLAQRVLKNVDHAVQPPPRAAESVPEPTVEVARERAAHDPVAQRDPHSSPDSSRPPASSAASPPPSSSSLDDEVPFFLPGYDMTDYEASPRSESAMKSATGSGGRARPSRAVRIATGILGAAVLLGAIGVGALALMRLGWIRSDSGSAGGTGVLAKSDRSTTSAANSQPADPAATPPQQPAANGATNAAGATAPQSNTPVAAFPPPGGLVVYDNNQEVFRVTPGQQMQSKQENAKSAIKASVPSAGEGAPSQAEAGTSPVVQLSEQDGTNNLLHRVEPEYPGEARQQGIQGVVVLDVRIARDGSVEDVQVISGQPLLVRAAMDAVKQWRFRPHAADGHPVEMETRVTLTFRLPQ